MMYAAIKLDTLRSIVVEPVPNHRNPDTEVIIRFRNAAGDDLLSVEVPVVSLHVRTQIALSHMRNDTVPAAPRRR